MFYSPNFSHVLPCLIVAVFFAYASAEPFKILDPVDKLSCQTCCDPMVTALNNVYQTTDAIDTISACQQACDIFSIVDNPSFAFCSSLTSGNANRRVGCEIGRDILFANFVSLSDGFGYRCNKDNFQTVFLNSLPLETAIVENTQISELDCQTCCSSFDGKFGSRFDAADVSSCQSSCFFKVACFVPSAVYDITADADHRQRLGCSLAVDWLNFAETRFVQINDFSNLEFIRVGCRNGVAVDLDNNNDEPKVFGLPLGMFVGIASSVLLCCTCVVIILCCCLMCQRKNNQNNQIPATIIIKALDLPEAKKIEIAQNIAGTEQKKTPPPVVVQKPAFAAFTSMNSLRPKYLSTWMFQKKQPIELPENLQPVIMESQNQKTGVKTQQQLQKSPVQAQPQNDKSNFAATATYVSSFDAGERYASPKKEVQKPNAELLRPTMPPPPKKLKQVRQESSVSEDIENQSGKMTEDDEEDDDENEAEVEKFPSEMPMPKIPKKSSLMKNTKSPKPPPKTVSKAKKMKSAEQMSETDDDEEEESEEEEEEEDKEKGKSEEVSDDAPEPPPRVPKNANENEL